MTITSTPSRLGSILAVALLAAACSEGSNPQSAMGPSGVGDGRASLLGAPPVSTIGPGQGTGTLPSTPNTCPTAGPQVNANQNNTKIDASLPGEFPAGVVKVDWVLLSNARQVVSKGTSLPTDPGGFRFIALYPKNGGTHYVVATVTYAGGCVGKPGETQVGFNTPQDNPDKAPSTAKWPPPNEEWQGL